MNAAGAGDVTVPAVAATAGRCSDQPALPRARGPLSSRVIEALRSGLPATGDLASRPGGLIDAARDEDVQLALYVCYELHYRGFAGVDPEWEWDPRLLAFRGALEQSFVRSLRAVVREATPGGSEAPVSQQLRALAEDDSGPSLSRHMQESGTIGQMREFAIHRSAYQLKEADPHTWVMPRLTGRAKACIATIQYDEYGSGSEAGSHSTRFAATMRELGLDDRYGAYLDVIPAVTLATVNLMSLFGLHRSWRGALVGHLALFEMTSVTPMSRYSNALGRLGLGSGARDFYDVHVVADESHECIGADMADALADAEPGLAPSILFGARSLTALERRFAEHLLGAWHRGRSSLRTV